MLAVILTKVAAMVISLNLVLLNYQSYPSVYFDNFISLAQISIRAVLFYNVIYVKRFMSLVSGISS